MSSLWPSDLTTLSVQSPVAILREQATFLGQATNNIISATVKRVERAPRTLRPLPDRDTKSPTEQISDLGSNQDFFEHDFYITAPALGNYRYLLFRIFHGFEPYPVTIFLGDDIKKELSLNSENLMANSEEEFEALLSAIFNTSKTRRVIGSILSQVDE